MRITTITLLFSQVEKAVYFPGLFIPVICGDINLRVLTYGQFLATNLFDYKFLSI